LRSSRRWLECVVVVPLCFYRLEAAARTVAAAPSLYGIPSPSFFLFFRFFFMIIVYITKKTRVSLLYANDWASIQRKNLKRKERRRRSSALGGVDHTARCVDLRLYISVVKSGSRCFYFSAFELSEQDVLYAIRRRNVSCITHVKRVLFSVFAQVVSLSSEKCAM
jgi:hypothetical protein